MTTTPDTKLAGDFAAAKLDQWRAMVDKALKGADFDKRLVSKTADGLRVEPLYTRKDALVSADRRDAGSGPLYARHQAGARRPGLEHRRAPHRAGPGSGQCRNSR